MKVIYTALLFSAIIGMVKLVDIVIIDSEMSEKMEEYVAGESLLILSDESDYNMAAKRLSDSMHQKYGGGWFTLVGANLNTGISGLVFAKNTSLSLRFKQIHVYLGQLQTKIDDSHRPNVTELTWQATIDQAKKANLVVNYNGNKTLMILSVNVTRKLLAGNSLSDCDWDRDTKYTASWCYYKLSEALELVLQRQVIKEGLFSVTTGTRNRCLNFSSGQKNQVIFTLGDIFFEITQYT